MDQDAAMDQDSVFVQVTLTAAPHAKNCEVLRFSEEKLWTCGVDGRLACSSFEGETLGRNWAQRISKLSTETPTAAISSDGRLLAVAEDTDAGFQVWVHQLEKGRMNTSQKPRNAGRFTLPISHLSWHATLPYLCISTDDGKLDVWWETKTEESESKGTASRRQLLRGENHLGGVRCAAIDPQLELLAAAFTSGELVVLTFPEGAEKHRSNLWPKAVSGSDHLRLAWQPNGQRLALPGSPSLRLLPRNFGEIVELKGGHRYSTTMAAWSPSGDVLASASCEAVALWSDDCLRRIFEFKAQPTSFAWSGSFLAVGAEGGHIARLSATIESSKTAEKPQEEEESGGADAPVDHQQAESQADEAKDEPQEPRIFKPAVQVKFQPGGTRRGRRRLLAWNDHGWLKLVISSSSKQRVVEVKHFKCQDPTSGRELKADGVEIGALGPGLCALASPSHVVVHLASLGTFWTSSFEHHLPGEHIEAVAISRSFVAIFVAPFRLLRLFTPSFIPLGVLAMPMDIVSMVACNHLLFCVFQARAKRDLRLHFSLFDVEKQEKLSSGRLPLSQQSTLRWIGFSADAGPQPLALDSAGILRALIQNDQWVMSLTPQSWVPVAELDADCKLWPVWAESGVLRCMEVRPGEEPKVPAQRLTTINYKLPVSLDGLDADKASGALLKHFLSHSKKIQRDSMVRLFEEHLKLKDSELALDIARCYLGHEQGHKMQSMQSLVQSAEKAGLNDLALRLETELMRMGTSKKRKLG
eukprot:s1952_g4.t1